MKKIKKTKKVVKQQPLDLTIERVIFNSEKGRLIALDVHDESTGMAYYLEVTGSHYHMTTPNKEKKKHRHAWGYGMYPHTLYCKCGKRKNVAGVIY